MSDNESHPNAGAQFNTALARIAVGGYDDMQDVRTACMNRIRDVVRKRNEGIPFDAVESEKDDDDHESKYEDEQLPKLVEGMRRTGELTEREFEYLTEVLEAAAVAHDAEKRFENIMRITETEPIFEQWLQHVYGVSTTLTARLLHKYGYCGPVRVARVAQWDGDEVVDLDEPAVVYDEREDDPESAAKRVSSASERNNEAEREGEDRLFKINGHARVSQMWSYSGLAPGQEPTRGEKLGYDPEAKTLAWLIADRIIMQGTRSEYKKRFFDPYKQEQERRMAVAEEMADEELDAVEWTPANSQAHADLRARRYLAKKFLKHYFCIARDLKGLHTPDEWVIAHGDDGEGHDKATDTWENPFYAKRQLRSEV